MILNVSKIMQSYKKNANKTINTQNIQGVPHVCDVHNLLNGELLKSFNIVDTVYPKKIVNTKI